jgi:hypothetical protein
MISNRLKTILAIVLVTSFIAVVLNSCATNRRAVRQETRVEERTEDRYEQRRGD